MNDHTNAFLFPSACRTDCAWMGILQQHERIVRLLGQLWRVSNQPAVHGYNMSSLVRVVQAPMSGPRRFVSRLVEAWAVYKQHTVHV